uniref:class E sortase n=1 Tax=Escherichia coli TaxID=562 RepID=UPI0013B42C81
GHYPVTGFPGEGRTIGVAGHRTPYGAPFRTIDRLKPRDPIGLEMPYGRCTYRVVDTRIVRPSATWVVRDAPRQERVVLTACHPLY